MKINQSNFEKREIFVLGFQTLPEVQPGGGGGILWTKYMKYAGFHTLSDNFRQFITTHQMPLNFETLKKKSRYGQIYPYI